MTLTRLISRQLPVLVALFVFLPGCASVYRNHDAGVADSQVARIKQRGMIFRVYDPSIRGSMRDILSLTPGDYILEFQLPSTGEAGKARCVLAAGKDYGLRISEKRYLPEAGTNVILGLCFETP
ncbi:MAG: hypothetical protein JNM27_08585 [Leptospirales bacterium]|nr:hypothetical protein [Leptospirales bacterium]